MRHYFCLLYTSQESAKAELAKYLPLKLTALDLLNHSSLRAFYAILGQEPINTLFLYQDQQGCLAVCERLQQRQVLQSQGDLSELYQQFTQRFPETIEQIYMYQTPDILNSHTIELLSQDWQLSLIHISRRNPNLKRHKKPLRKRQCVW